MPPKRGKAQAKQESSNTNGSSKDEKKPDVDQPKTEDKSSAKDDTKQSDANQKTGDPTNPKKRKTPTPSTTNEPQKSARRSVRSAPKSQPTREQLLNYMLSSAATALCRPEDEATDLASRGASIKTYADTPMLPFEELLCAVILSRPISHRLGLRSIRTVLNDPYNFTSPRAIRAAGAEKCHQAMWDARTQHKGKTAEQISQIAEVVLEKFTDSADDADGTQMSKLLRESDNDVDAALDTLKGSIKGLGGTGLNIFLRRVQWLWESGYPYVDDKTSLSLRKLGLPEEAEELRKAMEGVWGKLGNAKQMAGEGEAARKRRAFVVVLERAVGADLEGKVDEMVAEAAAA